MTYDVDVYYHRDFDYAARRMELGFYGSRTLQCNVNFDIAKDLKPDDLAQTIRSLTETCNHHAERLFRRPLVEFRRYNAERRELTICFEFPNVEYTVTQNLYEYFTDISQLLHAAGLGPDPAKKPWLLLPKRAQKADSSERDSFNR